MLATPLTSVKHPWIDVVGNEKEHSIRNRQSPLPSKQLCHIFLPYQFEQPPLGLGVCVHKPSSNSASRTTLKPEAEESDFPTTSRGSAAAKSTQSFVWM